MVPLRRPAFTTALLAGGLVLAAGPATGGDEARVPPAATIRWPAGTAVLSFENLEGLILLPATLRGRAGADTTGPLALDTGAGHLALDLGLSRALGLADTSGPPAPETVGLAREPLPRLTLGGWSLERVEPVLTVDGAVVRRVSDRPVLGLLGHGPLADRAVWIDYRGRSLALVPGSAIDAEAPAGGADADADPTAARAARRDALERSRALLAPGLSPAAVAVHFRLLGDGKILVRGAVSDPHPPDWSRRLNLIVDTGATKCVLFEDAIEGLVRHAGRWPSLRGLAAPTLIGSVPARISRVPGIELEGARGRLREPEVDVGILRSDLSRVLARATDETIHGLIGYSFLRRFRVAVDYPNQVLWLDPIPGWRDDRPLEYCHVGLQVERRAGEVVVTGVVEDSPAARAGVAPGDRVVSLDGAVSDSLDLSELIRRMEGEPGRPLTLVLRRDAVDRTLRLVRRRLL